MHTDNQIEYEKVGSGTFISASARQNEAQAATWGGRLMLASRALKALLGFSPPHGAKLEATSQGLHTCTSFLCTPACHQPPFKGTPPMLSTCQIVSYIDAKSGYVSARFTVELLATSPKWIFCDYFYY